MDLFINMMFSITIIKEITIRKENIFIIICWKIWSQHVSCTATLLRRLRVIQRFGRRALSDNEGKIGSTSEIDPKYATNFEHTAVHL